ncbi:hypothetical protein [Aeromicrobium fastidiosum]|uniref:Uncharacterized protein n=1 Tax=Aeromicrobium fastidiosum TaxID=52699 RepID=A0A641AII0_9ACTN|nr:hypothetical protein [Aeromicrobium fastidiosum]KAA1374677.1 hypothetical protein ESP62_014895 [Aeromicrobium fastidiosum]MBP2390776.1 hypothetical protein [Aeromicrobium fastidiosum]
MAMMLMTIPELAAVIDSVDQLTACVSECLGGAVITSEGLRETGHAALGVRFLALSEADQVEFLATVAELRAAAARHLVDGCDIIRLAAVDAAGRMHVALVFDQFFVVTISGGWCGVMNVEAPLTREDLVELLPVVVEDSRVLTVQRYESSGWAAVRLLPATESSGAVEGAIADEWSRMVCEMAGLGSR